jgi:hypothetical protein
MTKYIVAAVDRFAGKTILGALLLGFTGWTALSMYERIQQIRAHPDLNGDGTFSILDIPAATASVFMEVGHRYQAVLAKSKAGRFLEMRSDNPNIFWSVVLASFTYFLIIVWLSMLFDEPGPPNNHP